jgi:hypothetical protein
MVNCWPRNAAGKRRPMTSLPRLPRRSTSTLHVRLRARLQHTPAHWKIYLRAAALHPKSIQKLVKTDFIGRSNRDRGRLGSAWHHAPLRKVKLEDRCNSLDTVVPDKTKDQNCYTWWHKAPGAKRHHVRDWNRLQFYLGQLHIISLGTCRRRGIGNR